jgi:hypothetical protein
MAGTQLQSAFLLVAAIVLGIAVAALLVVAGMRKDLRLAVAICCVSVVTAVETANIAVLPAVDPLVSARPYAELLQNDLHPDRIFVFQLKRTWNYGLAFYLRRGLPEWSPEDPNAALVLTNREGLEKIEQAGRFHGELEQSNRGILVVPIESAPR